VCDSVRVIVNGYMQSLHNVFVMLPVHIDALFYTDNWTTT